MTHLKIELNNGTRETVASSVIKKLYDLAKEIELDVNGTIALKGWLYTSATYLDYITYLENISKVNGEPLLTIDAGKAYITFADPTVASYWANSTYGDGTGIDSTSAASVLSVPNNAFKDNTNILTFDELNKFSNCTTLGNDAFHDSTISSINLSNITTLGTSVFSGCTNITGIFNLPCVNSIGAYGLRNLNATEINIGSNVSDSNKITIIPNLTFYLDTNLLKVTGLSKVTSLGGQAFYYCSNLTSLDLTSELTTITAGETFRGCSELQCINFLNVSNLSYDGTFMYCDKLVDLGTSDINNINTGAATYTFDWSSIPANTFTATLLTNKSLIFPNATIVKSAAFNTCTGVVAISIPNVISIKDYAFLKCSSLTTINMSNVQTIGQYAFYDCTSLNSSISLSNCTSISNDAFRHSGITSFSAPNITSVEGGSFRDCTSLQTASFSNNVNTFGSHMFVGCTSLTSVLIPTSITILKESSFRGCSSLTSITIPPNITSIERYCFFNSGLTSISIPSSVTEIGIDCFTMSALTSITFEPNSLLTTLGGGCFNGCSLTTIDIPDSCTTMGSNIFIDSNTISSIIIGTGIQTIDRSFTNGSNYTLTVKATTPPTFNNTGCRKPTAIYVPSGSVSAYLSASGWSDWADVIQVIST